MTYIVNDNCIMCKHTDCVEVCPPHDNGNTSALAARLIRHLVGAVWQSQQRFK